MKKILLTFILFINFFLFSEPSNYSFVGVINENFEIDESSLLKLSEALEQGFNSIPDKNFIDSSENKMDHKTILVDAIVIDYKELLEDDKFFMRIDLKVELFKFEDDGKIIISDFDISLAAFEVDIETVWEKVLSDITKHLLFNINSFPENEFNISVQGFYIGEVLINAGSSYGFKRDDELEVFLNDKSEKAIIRIEHIFEDSALCSVVRNGHLIKKGHSVRFRKQGYFYNTYYTHINKINDSYSFSSGVNFIYRRSKINIYPFVGFEILSPFANIFNKETWFDVDKNTINDIENNTEINSYIGWHIARHIKNFYLAGNVSLLLRADVGNNSQFSHWGQNTGAIFAYSFNPNILIGIEGGRKYYLTKDKESYNNEYANYFGLSLIVRK